MVRWITPLIAGLIVLALLPSVYSLETWGCCIPPVDVCFDGNQGFTTEADFVSACDDVGGTLQPGVTSCGGFSQCSIGCCCAGPGVVNSGQINTDPTLIETTEIACYTKVAQGQDYSWEGQPPSGQTCVEVCSGSAPPGGGGDTYTVSGTVKNGTGNQALENVEVFIPIPSGAISDMTDEFGKYTLLEVPAMNSRVYAIHPACNPGVHPELEIDEDKTGVDINLNCELGACDPDAPEVLSVDSVTGSSVVTITADLDDNCQSFIQYEPQRCDANWENCNPLQPTNSDVIEDGNVDPETTYCYIVNARFGDGTVTSSGTTNSGACTTTGVEECMNLPADAPVKWCGITEEAQAVVKCGEGNVLEVVDQCELEEICTMTGGAACIPMPECERCNGLLGLFGDAELEIEIDGFLRVCGEETPICFADTSFSGRPMSFDTFSSCAAVTSCADYVSGESCGLNPCGLDDVCNWQEVIPELGKGVCLGEERPSCSACEDVMGFCNRDVCSAISPECYYDGKPNGLSGELGPQYCIHRDDLGCRYYDTQEDCEGGTPAVFDVNWNGGVRSGTNALTIASKDNQSLGTCSWIASQNRCVKNADMFMEQNEDDCYENGRYRDDKNCFEDNTPPETEWFLLDPPVYSIPAVRTWPFAVYDEESPVGLIRTKVCLSSAGSCNPNSSLSALRLPDEGTYSLYYYSIDASENAEVVKSYPEQIIIQDYGEAVLREARLEPQD